MIFAKGVDLTTVGCLCMPLFGVRQAAMAYRDEKNMAMKQALTDLDNKRANVMKLTGIPGKERQRQQAEEEVARVRHDCCCACCSKPCFRCE